MMQVCILQLVDVDIFCLTNLIETIYAPKDAAIVVADIGASVTNIAIIKGERIEFTREILVGDIILQIKFKNHCNYPSKRLKRKTIRQWRNLSFI